MRLPKIKEIRGFAAESVRQLIERPLYTLGIRGYGVAVRLGGIFNPKARRLSQGQKRIWSYLEKHIDPKSRYIWIHSASLGEFEQGRPLIERLKRERPEYRILLTFFSPSGYEVRKDFPLADAVCYLPFDTRANARRFLYTVNPEMAIFVKYEIWRNYLEELYRRQIPVYMISAVFRHDQYFFKKAGAWYALWLKWYTGFFVQNEESRRLLESVGVRNVVIAGDTRFDRVSEIRRQGKRIPVLERFRGDEEAGSRNLVIMAGSSWPADENVYSDWIAAHPEVKLVIAPHEFDAARLAALKERFGPDTLLMSEAEMNPDAIDKAKVLVIDCFGLLSSAYAYCDIAYVGGGFGSGLHNINEAAVYDVPVIYGPNNAKFIEAREMAEAGGGFPVADRREFEQTADKLTGSADCRKEAGRKAGEYIRSKIGATDIIFRKLFP